jgi:hypothetical protein
MLLETHDSAGVRFASIAFIITFPAVGSSVPYHRPGAPCSATLRFLSWAHETIECGGQNR